MPRDRKPKRRETLRQLRDSQPDGMDRRGVFARSELRRQDRFKSRNYDSGMFDRAAKRRERLFGDRSRTRRETEEQGQGDIIGQALDFLDKLNKER